MLTAPDVNHVKAHLKGTCDRIICDPPFLSEDCQTKGRWSLQPLALHCNYCTSANTLTPTPLAAITVRWLSKPPTPLPSLTTSSSPAASPVPSLSSSPSTTAATTTTTTTTASDDDADYKGQQQQQRPRLVVCTGERMEGLVTRLYRAFGLRTTDFEPAHARGLSNEFYCYANFESPSWGWRRAGRDGDGEGEAGLVGEVVATAPAAEEGEEG